MIMQRTPLSSGFSFIILYRHTEIKSREEVWTNYSCLIFVVFESGHWHGSDLCDFQFGLQRLLQHGRKIDIIYNTAGCMIGVLLALAVIKILR